MSSTIYTPEQVAEAVPFISTLKSAQQDKQFFAKAIAEAFINGMNAQEYLTAQLQRESIEKSA